MRRRIAKFRTRFPRPEPGPWQTNAVELESPEVQSLLFGLKWPECFEKCEQRGRMETCVARDPAVTDFRITSRFWAKKVQLKSALHSNKPYLEDNPLSGSLTAPNPSTSPLHFDPPKSAAKTVLWKARTPSESRNPNARTSWQYLSDPLKRLRVQYQPPARTSSRTLFRSRSPQAGNSLQRTAS